MFSCLNREIKKTVNQIKIIVFPRNFISFSLEGADLVYSTWIPIQSILRTVPWDFYLFIVVFINQYTLRSLLHILKYFGFWLFLVHVYKFISWESTTKMYITSQSVLGYQGVVLRFSKACHKFYWGDSQNNGLWIFFLFFFLNFWMTCDSCLKKFPHFERL